MRAGQMLAGVLLLGLGFVLGGGGRLEAGQETPEGYWEIHHAPYAEQSFYVIKHNPETGETWVLDARRGSEDDVWKQLPEGDGLGE